MSVLLIKLIIIEMNNSEIIKYILHKFYGYKSINIYVMFNKKI